MTKVSYIDIKEVFVSLVLFYGLVVFHKVVIPQKYQSILAFRSDVTRKQIAASTALRILYTSILSLVLHRCLLFSERNIYCGIFVACFLIVWPAIVQYRLFFFWRTSRKTNLFFGYLLYIVFTILFSFLTIKCVEPMLFEHRHYEILDNSIYSILLTLFSFIVPVGAESILAVSYVPEKQELQGFSEKLQILDRQLRLDDDILNYYACEIEKESEINGISPVILKTIISLERINRGTWPCRMAERIVCKIAPHFATRRDFSVGLAQIKITTAQKILKESPDAFLMKLFDNRFSIALCAKILKEIIIEYGHPPKEKEYLVEQSSDVYQYLAYSYLTNCLEIENETVALYGAILRSRDCEHIRIEKVKDWESFYHLSGGIIFSDTVKVLLAFNIHGIKDRIGFNNAMEYYIGKGIEGYSIDGNGIILYFPSGSSILSISDILCNIAKMLRVSFGIRDVENISDILAYKASNDSA